MADKRDDRSADNENEAPIAGQDGDRNEFGERGRAEEQDGMVGQPIGGNDSATGTGTTLTQGADFGQGTTSNAGGSRVGADQTSGGSSGVSGGEGFMGSRADSSSDYLQNNDPASNADAPGGTDFARQGRGATDDGDDGAGGS